MTKLFAYGFEEVAIRMSLPGTSVFQRFFFQRSEAHLTKAPLAVRLRLLLEELGPTFVKLGQVLSLRSDLLPDEITGELRKLQTQALPFDGNDARRIVEEELGKPIDRLFSRFEIEPISAASISQVHKAVTKSGKRVAVKVQRPNATETVDLDVALLHDIARLAVRHLPASRMYKPVEVIDQFERTLKTELDFYHEGRTMELFRDLFRNFKGIYFPDVAWEFTTERVLTTEYLDGFGLDRVSQTNKVPFDRKLIAKRGAQYVLEQVFEHGIFNADPHPGNFIVLSDNVLGAVDFGMIGSLDEQMKGALVGSMEAFFRREPDRLLRVFERLNILSDETDTTSLRQELTTIVNYYYNIPVAHLHAGQILTDLAALIRRYQIAVPVDVTLVLKVIITLEGLGKEIDPDFNVIQAFRPFLARRLARRFGPGRYAKSLSGFSEDLMDLMQTLPYETGLLLKKLRTGQLRVQMDHQNLGPPVGLVAQSLNRLSFSIIITGILIGSSLMIQLKSMPSLFGIPIVALGGYAISAALGLWLIVGIIRSRTL